MNTPNNKRRRDSQRKIENAFVHLIQLKEIDGITITEICRDAGVNRTTFYANYLDIYDLSEKICQKLEKENELLYKQDWDNSTNYHLLDIVRNVYENRLFYKTYFKLGRDHTYIVKEYDMGAANSLYHGIHIDYHMLYFMSGFSAMLRKWLFDDCPFPPEEFMEILSAEYQVTGEEFLRLVEERNS